MSLAGGLAGSLALDLFRLQTSLAFAASFALAVADFWWMSWGLQRVMSAPKGAPLRPGAFFYMGMLLRTGLLLLGLYAILHLLPRESLGVGAGIGGALFLLALAGTLPTRG